MKRMLIALLVPTICLSGIAAHADRYHLIICGSGGEPEYVQRFADWGRSLRTALIDVALNDAACVLLLTEGTAAAGEDAAQTGSEAAGTVPERRSDLDTIRSVIREIETTMRPNDDIFVYLIGHGSHRRDTAKFVIPGPDLSAEELGVLLGRLPAENRVIINGTSSSAGFINTLGPSEHLVCTATKSVDERNATEFMGHFVRAIEEGTADSDHDGRMSLFEVCNQGATLTAAWYKNSGLIATEHALLEDNGDGLGTRLPIETQAAGAAVDGERAMNVYIKAREFSTNVPETLVQEYEAALQAVEDLKETKSQYPESDYYEKLETLLVRAARANRAIHDAAMDASSAP